jgi:hypothetical protein
MKKATEILLHHQKRKKVAWYNVRNGTEWNGMSEIIPNFQPQLDHFRNDGNVGTVGNTRHEYAALQ